MKSRILYILLWGMVSVISVNGWAQTKGIVRGNEVKMEQNRSTWQKLSVAEFEKLLPDTTLVLIDVRTADEYKSGHIPGAKNIDVKQEHFDREIGKLDLHRPVAVYCRSGVRSTLAATKLTQKGFKVFELEKGFNSWTGKKEK